MKTTLKTFPTWKQLKTNFNKALSWKEAFEKELKEKYAKLCEIRISDMGADNQAFLIEEIFDAEAEEILGE